jgi:hypothetical protein
MNTTEKLNSVEKETLQLILEEYVQEQAGNTKVVNDLITVVNGLTSKFKEFEEKIEKPKAVNVSTDTRPILDIVKKGITDIKLTVSARPQPVIRKFQILLFPEQDAKLFYKVVFGRWFLFLVIAFFISSLYNWGVHWSDNQKEVKQIQLENDKIRKAWYSLYDQQGKAGKRLMDSAYLNGN